MVNCPKCGNEVNIPAKEWKYSVFFAQAFVCNKCGTEFREYTKDGKHSFMLKKVKGQNWKKVR